MCQFNSGVVILANDSLQHFKFGKDWVILYTCNYTSIFLPSYNKNNNSNNNHNNNHVLFFENANTHSTT